MPIPPTEPAALSLRRFWRWSLALIVAGAAAYWTSFDGIFLLDDEYTITDNADIDDWSKAFRGPKGAPSSGRPLTSFSFALDWHLSEALEPLGLKDGGRNSFVYHFTNLLIHLGAGITLFALVANTLRRCPGYARVANPAGWVTALFWIMHPMNTSAVTYMSQRAESLMALFFLLAVWAAERASRAPTVEKREDMYAAITAFALLAAMGKENAVALTFLIPLYDRAFLYPTWAEALRARRNLWLMLLIPWPVVLWIQMSDPRGGTVLLQYQMINPLTYLYTQANGISMYLRKVFWPDPILLDYGWPIATRFRDCAANFLLLAGLVALTLWAVPRRPRVGYAGAWFFIILGPSSSVIPIITEIWAEHRMYLPMMPLIALAVSVAARAAERSGLPLRFPLSVAVAGTAVALGWKTSFHNGLYRDAVDMWEYNGRHTPDNRRVFYNICVKSRVDRNDYKRAEEAGRQTLRISPDYPDAHMQMAIVLKETGRLEEALHHARIAVELEPGKGHHYSLLADVHMRMRRYAEARAVLVQGLERDMQSQDCMLTTLRLQLLSETVDTALRQASLWIRLPPENPAVIRRVREIAEELEKDGVPGPAAELRRRFGDAPPAAEAPTGR